MSTTRRHAKHRRNGARTIIITDLDGTFLDRKNFSFDESLSALHAARAHDIPIVFCSSKTLAEQLFYRNVLDIHDPFIVEDGGALYIEKGYFPFSFSYDATVDDLLLIELGTTYDKIRRAIRQVRDQTGIELVGYGDVSVDEVAEVLGMNPGAAALAKAREYQETILSPLERDQAEKVRALLEMRGLRLARGDRFFSITGQTDKGRAVKLLADLYRKKFGDVRLVGIGDSFNDIPLLSAVDVPVLVKKPKDEWEEIEVPGMVKVDGIGPVGWSRFVLGWLS